jgi:thioesterase domain-containing protein
VIAGCDNVHIFLLNGFSLLPHPYGRLTAISGSLEELGYHHIYKGNPYYTHRFASQIRSLRHGNPDARIVLVGYSCGGGAIQRIANELAGDGICIDLLIYVDAVPLSNSAYPHLTNVSRVVSITSADPVLHGEEVPEATNCHVQDAWHFSITSNQQTRAIVLGELATLANHSLTGARLNPHNP